MTANPRAPLMPAQDWATTMGIVCPWKGTASYFTIAVDGKENPDAAWVYREPKPEAAHLKGHIGFWRGVEIQK